METKIKFFLIQKFKIYKFIKMIKILKFYFREGKFPWCMKLLTGYKENHFTISHFALHEFNDSKSLNVFINAVIESYNLLLEGKST